jgi:hypothetical protein
MLADVQHSPDDRLASCDDTTRRALLQMAGELLDALKAHAPALDPPRHQRDVSTVRTASSDDDR